MSVIVADIWHSPIRPWQKVERKKESSQVGRDSVEGDNGPFQAMSSARPSPKSHHLNKASPNPP